MRVACAYSIPLHAARHVDTRKKFMTRETHCKLRAIVSNDVGTYVVVIWRISIKSQDTKAYTVSRLGRYFFVAHQDALVGLM